jgi:dTDP-4-amino-4,6-dideoxygalactose transaminase
MMNRSRQTGLACAALFLLLGTDSRLQSPPANTALLAAARNGDTAAVSSLLDSGADVNADNGHGLTALYYAADKANVPLVRLLLERGANPDAKLKAILPVDVFGQPSDLEPILNTAWKYKLGVIEDSCEALGAEYKNRPAGTLGDYGVFGFYPNKQVTTGEGGMIITDDDDAASLMRALRNQGRAPGDTWLQHTHLGYNYRLDEMSAALGLVQIKRLDAMIDRRSQVAEWYNQRLPEIPGIEIPHIAPYTTRVSWFVYVIRFAKGIERDVIAKKLGDKGIPARPYFLPIHLQPYMVERFGYQEGIFPVTEDLGKRGLALPFSGVMEERQVDHVCRVLRDVIA